MAADITFPSIGPAPVQDYRTFDFTSQIQTVPPGAATPTPVITNAIWSIALEPSSEVPDDLVATRLIGAPINDNTHTSQMVGGMIESAVYVLTAQVTLSDGRILIRSGELACFSQQEPVLVPADPNVVPFDYDRFVSAFPQFAGVNTDAMERFWTSAGLIFRNDATSPEQDLPTRAYLLGLLAAHIAAIFAAPGVIPGTGGHGGAGMVGRINSKSVNGVSVGSEGFQGVSGTQAWYLTTQYGAMYWRMTAAYRTMHYFPGPVRFPSYVGSPWGPYGGRWLT